MCLLAKAPPRPRRPPPTCLLEPIARDRSLSGKEPRRTEAACRRRARGHVEPLAPGGVVHAGPVLTTAPSRSNVRAALLAALCLATFAITIAARCYVSGSEDLLPPAVTAPAPTAGPASVSERTKRAGSAALRRPEDQIPGGHSASDNSDHNQNYTTKHPGLGLGPTTAKTKDNQGPEEQQHRPGSQRPMPSAHDQPANACEYTPRIRHLC